MRPAEVEQVIASAAHASNCSAGLSSAGAVRIANEDAFLERCDLGLWAVADGMGGHQRGGLASRLVVDALDTLSAFESGHSFLQGVRDRLGEANRALLKSARALGPGAIVGSTVVALLVFDGHFACVWAGDSRAYRIRAGGIEQLTRDHNLLQEMIDRGEIGPGEVARHRRDAHVVTRALGVTEPAPLEIVHGPVIAGDRFLLCSDGLSATVREEELSGLAQISSPREGATAILNRAMARGPDDNVTLVLIAPT